MLLIKFKSLDFKGFSLFGYEIWILVFLPFNILIAQNEQIELAISNDKIVFVDKYYTSGLHLTYRKALEEEFLFSKKEDNKLQINVVLGNETYTPRNLTSFNTNYFDRPYAGWFFAGFEIGQIKDKSAIFMGLETGITGKESLSGKLQLAFHDLVGTESKPTWADEISYKWLVNLKSRYVLDFNLNNHHILQNRLSSSLGTKDVFLENDLYYFFGRMNALKTSSRLYLVDETQTNEFYGFVSVGYKYVVLNTLIQGSPFNDKDPFTTEASKSVFRLSAGSVLKLKKTLLGLVLQFNTKETPASTSHAYGTVSFARSF